MPLKPLKSFKVSKQLKLAKPILKPTTKLVKPTKLTTPSRPLLKPLKSTPKSPLLVKLKLAPFIPPQDLPEEYTQRLSLSHPSLKAKYYEVDWDKVNSIHDVKAILSTLNLKFTLESPALLKIGYLVKPAVSALSTK